MESRISVKNDFIGYHRYSNAPQDVVFLRYMHRHHFIVTTTIEVKHNNREIEFFELQSKIEIYVKKVYPDVKDTGVLSGLLFNSCEDLAKTIIEYLDGLYPNRYISCEVSEDGECSGIVIKDSQEKVS
jgi:hypothetical protein